MMNYKPAPLPYAFDALEPYIDKETMEIHYTKHYQGYVNHLNEALEKHPEFAERVNLKEMLLDLSRVPEDIRTAVRHNGGGDYNHTMFWLLMKKNGGGEPKGSIGEALKKTFGSFKVFQEQFNQAAKTVFGSGWSWLSVDRDGKLILSTTPDQDTPLAQGMQPIFGLDVWEHAYYLKYQNRRPDYINAWWHVIDWETVEENYLSALE
jgi:superoxide dismutase, Fe-Mn family